MAMDKFFTQKYCDRCKKDLRNGRTMSAFSTECICMECKYKEKIDPEYKKAKDAEIDQIKKGNYNFKGMRGEDMNRALFARKAVDIDEIKNITGLDRDKKYYVIEKTIELDEKEFDEFADDLLEDRDFIKDNIDFMFVDSNSVWHCLLVKAKGRDEGLLIEAEGYSYSRYTALWRDDECITK